MGGAGAGAGLGILCCALVGGILLGTFIGSVILLAACALYNMMAGGAESPSAVPVPTLGRGMGIVFVTFIVQMPVSLGIRFLLSGGNFDPTARQDPQTQLLSSLIGLPVGFLIMSGMLTAMLPTTFPRAMLVALLEYVIMIAIAVVIVVILVLIFGASMFLGNH